MKDDKKWVCERLEERRSSERLGDKERETSREFKQTQEGQRERLAERVNRHKKDKERETGREIKQTQEGQRGRLATD